VAYWRTRREHGERFRDVAAALGVAHWSLHRWMRESTTRARFRPVAVAGPPPSAAPPVVLVMSATGPRVEGLDVESVARLLTLLR
jgi:hypothetical protein